ncbi:MAG: metallophosphoesterase [Christensenellaceae bacterium]|jgi:hypothetical protein|nr:metallophosphoesterase [Christensenellaceae bacterium]
MKRICILLYIACLVGLCGCAAAPASLPSVTPLPLSPVATPAPPTPTPDALSAQGGVYTFAWISDTQYYSRSYPEIYAAMTAFLRDNAKRLNLAYILHTGDLVNNYDQEEQWLAAVRAMSSLARLPYGVLAGNHDVHHDDANYTNFSAYFGEAQFAGRPWYGGSYQNNRGHYDLIDADGTQYIFVFMGYAPDAKALAWLRATFAQYPNRVGVLCLHDYLDTDLSLLPTGAQIYEKVVRRSPNLYMVLCGHRYNVGCVPAAFDDDGDGAIDRTVYQMIGNYQAAGDTGGGGYMRFLQIDEQEGVIRTYSYSPVAEDYTYFDTPEAQAEKYTADPANESAVYPIPW